MQALVSQMRTVAAGIFVAFALLGAVVQAEDKVATPTAVAEPWQAVITGQIEAFRAKDAAVAFQYAAAGFQANFPSAEAFFAAIVGSGYGPIMESRSHSFGKFEKVDDKTVLQEVHLVGNDQSLYAAIYQLTEETNGWRVQGVQLLKQPGMAI